ncbi:MAG: PspC domain-containing protein [Chloroflexota bacterium]|nr:PspC domain-containing protein [Chloroflexota bacterium]
MTDRPARLLRRRSADRVIGGVAGGLGDYFNVDPLLIRIGFVGLIMFGGAGLVLYLLAWLLLPVAGKDVSIVEGFIRWLGLTTPRRILWIALAIIAFFVFQSVSARGYIFSATDLGLDGPTWLALAGVGAGFAGFWLLRRRESAPSATASATFPAQPVTPIVKAPPRPPSPLAWYVVAATLVAIGLLALVSQMASVEVAPGQFFGAGLTVIGIGLVVGAWWGRARILILLALLLLPMAVTASFITAPLEGGIGDQRYTPVTPAELRDEYRLLGGRLVLDLTQLTPRDVTMHIALSVALGEVVVMLPPGASVELDARVGAGATYLYDASQVGTSLVDRYVRRHLHAPTYILDLEAGIGAVQVYSGGFNR